MSRAVQGDAQAHWELAICYKFGKGVKSDKEKSFSCFKAAVENGFEDGLIALGGCYWQGFGTERNIEAALVCFDKEEARKDHATEAQLLYYRGLMYLEGCGGVEKDACLAVEHFKNANGLWAPYKYLELAKCYHYGIGIAKDVNKSKIYATEALHWRVEGAVVFWNESHMWQTGIIPRVIGAAK